MRISISLLAFFVIPFVASAQKEAKKEIEKPRVNQEQIKPVEEPKQAEEIKPIEETKPVEETKPLEVTKPVEVTPANEAKPAEQTTTVKKEEINKTPATTEAPVKVYKSPAFAPRTFKTIPIKATFKTAADTTKK